MTVTICGSLSFVEDMKDAQKSLKKLGVTSLLPDPLASEESFQQKHGREKFLEMKPVWTRTHFSKIKKSDAIVVVNNTKRNIEGYIGPNTLMEIGVAYFLDKLIYFTNPISPTHPFYEELASMNTIVLNSDYTNIRIS